jgi:lysophospholipase L1-like esterase
MLRTSSRLWLWHLPAAVGAAAALFFAGAFWLALRGSAGQPLGSPPPAPALGPVDKPSGERFVLVLGDSLAKGTGDETGKGYAGVLLDRLKKTRPATMANLAVPGAVSEDIAALVEGANVRSLAASADLILLSAGGNDLSRAVREGAGSPVRLTADVAKARSLFLQNMRTILGRLREANTTAPIYVLGLYDPFGGAASGDPDASPTPLARARLGVSVISGWNLLLGEAALSYKNVHVVPTLDLFAARPDYLGLDRFHPGGAGYAAIAERVYQLLPQALR